MRNSRFNDRPIDGVLRTALVSIEAACEAAGVPVLLYQGLRDPREQARAYRASRKTTAIREKADALTEAGYPAWGRVLWDVGPQYGRIGRHVTWAAPGESFHQYGLACDGCPVIDGRLAWSYAPDDPRAANAWQIMGAAIEAEGLEWGGRWKRVDMPHMQRGTGLPLETLSAEAVRHWIDYWAA